MALECVDKRAGGGIIDTTSPVAGISLKRVIRFERKVKTQQYVVETHVAIHRCHPLFLLRVILIEMRLYAHHLVVVGHTRGQRR